MQRAYPLFMQTPTGGVKVYFMGQANDHLMDWAGMNYRTSPVPGFATVDEAVAWFQERYCCQERFAHDTPHHDGTHHGEESNRRSLWDAKHGLPYYCDEHPRPEKRR